MTCGISKIVEAAEESARKGRPVPLAWKPDEVPEGYIMNTQKNSFSLCFHSDLMKYFDAKKTYWNVLKVLNLY